MIIMGVVIIRFIIIWLCLFSMQRSLTAEIHHSGVNAMGFLNRRLQMEIREIHNAPFGGGFLSGDYSLPRKRRSVHNDLKP
ncbi:hypothetical protein PHJA_000641800 [Phtheirospermum japonicum]|uniref:Secreted protein n=1 Tax=Phtheirospermum japonicum TaxID=374723 RepID=A0A830BBB0_9LAMI|nr:hypothetical protein PHJA_000641800 [Phtheirospermum japonicum]